MSSIGRCSYEFMETFRLRDVKTGSLKYAKRVLERAQYLGINDPDVEHYVKASIAAAPSCRALVSLTLIPYGEPLYADTACLESSSWLGLVPVIIAYITGALGHDIGDRVTMRHAGRLAEWLKSVGVVYSEGKA